MFFGLSLIDTGNLVHTAIISGEFWEAIGERINRTMDYKVGTADGQSEKLQVLGLGEPWSIFLEEIGVCYLLEPLVIQGMSHSVNLGKMFLQKNRLKLVCTDEEVTMMPVKDDSALRARLVDGGCISFENRRLGKIWRATREQEISAQTWIIPREKITINVLKDGVEENVGVYDKEQCSIPAGMGKYIPVQTNREVQGDVLSRSMTKP